MNAFRSHPGVFFAAAGSSLCVAIAMLALAQVHAGYIIVCSVLAIALLCLWAAHDCRQENAIGHIARCMQKLARGDYSADITAAAFGGHGSLATMTASMETALGRILSEYAFARGVLQGMGTPCVVVDASEVLRFTNKNLLTILQHDGQPADFYGQNVAFFFYGDATRPTVLGAALREKRDITKEVELVGRKGARRNIRIDASPLYDLQGQLMGSLCVYADLTELRAKEANLLAVNARIAQTSEQADGVGRQLAQAARQLTELVSRSRSGADQQSSRMAETATAMEEMNATVMKVARNAAQAAETSAQAKNHAENGAAVVGKVVEGILDTQRETLGLKQDMTTLGTQANAIGQIINVISDIADQTNLLALNAAIEAARAGDAGRGFAVVADEVRKLAEKTMSATKEVDKAIRGIQNGTTKSISSVEKAVQRIDDAATMASKSGEALEQIVRLVEATSNQMHSIATASGEQSAVSEEISKSIEEVSSISVATAKDMTQAARAVEDLAGQAQVLSDLIREMQQQG